MEKENEYNNDDFDLNYHESNDDDDFDLWDSTDSSSDKADDEQKSAEEKEKEAQEEANKAAEKQDGIKRDSSGRPMLHFPSLEEGEDSAYRTPYADSEELAETKEDEISVKQFVDEIKDENEFYYNPISPEQEIANQEFTEKELTTAWNIRGPIQSLRTLDVNKRVQFAKEILERFGDQRTIDRLNVTGLGSHPYMIQAVYTAGKRIQMEAKTLLDEKKKGMLQFKGMANEQLGEMGRRAKQILKDEIYEAKGKIIQRHGPMPVVFREFSTYK